MHAKDIKWGKHEKAYTQKAISVGMQKKMDEIVRHELGKIRVKTS